jgi:integrase
MTRPLSDLDRRRVLTALREWAGSGSIVGLRTQAICLLAADSGLRVAEVIALRAGQLVASSEPLRLVDRGYLQTTQAKGGHGGPFDLSRRAREAIHAYVRAAVAAGWMAWPVAPASPLWLGHRGHRGAKGHGALSIRSAQRCWYEAQRRAGVPERYGFHCLRHDAATRLRRAGADVFDVAGALRLVDLRHAQRYVHRVDASTRLPTLVGLASRL